MSLISGFLMRRVGGSFCFGFIHLGLRQEQHSLESWKIGNEAVKDLYIYIYISGLGGVSQKQQDSVFKFWVTRQKKRQLACPA